MNYKIMGWGKKYLLNRGWLFWGRQRLWSKSLQFLSITLICFTVVVACNPQQSSIPNQTSNGNGNGENRLSIGTTLKPRTLDPADSYELSGLNLIYNLGDTLYTYESGTTKIIPQLATEVPTISEDGLTYTINLREGVKFHDGSDFNAEAMVFSLKRFMENGGKPSFLLRDIVKEVKAGGEYEITIELKQPFAAFTSLLAFAGTCAVSPDAYQIGEGQFNPNQFVGTGPYKLVQSSSDSIRLEIFSDYWGEKPANEGVDIQIYSGNSANLFNGFRTGAVDLAYQSLDPDQINNLLAGGKQGQWQAIEAGGSAINYLVLNRNQKPLDQLPIRQARGASSGRTLLNQRVLQGQGEPVYSLIPTAFSAYKPTFTQVNVKEAQKLIEEAGYSPSNPMVIEIWYPSSSTTRALVASTIKAYAEKELAGLVRFEVNSVEGATAFSNLRKGVYPSFLSNWYPDFLDADNYIQPLLSCSKGSEVQGCEDGASQSQGSFYYNPQMNQLIEQQRQEQNQQKRQAIFAQIQEILAQDAPYIPLWQNKDYVFVQNGVAGVQLNPSQNIAFWTISK